MHIKRYLAGFVPSIAQSIAFGIGDAAEAIGDTKLQFEAGRVDISLTSYDFVNNRLVYKAQLPESFQGTISEVGLYTTSANDVAGQYGSNILTTFDSDTEEWIMNGSTTPSTFTTGAFSRIGTNSLTQNPAVSDARYDMLTSVALDLSGYSGADKFSLAYNVGNAFVANVAIFFFTDSFNYYQFNLGVQTAGYKVTEVNKGVASVVGTPNWSNITSISVATASTAGGTGLVQFDGLRIEDTDTVNPNYLMVARELVSPTFTKEAGKVQEIEFALNVTV